MMALSITAMCGFLALAVDLGVAYLTRKSAQTAADAAALAGATQALSVYGVSGVYGTCPTGVVCQAETACASSPTSPPVTNIDNACLYALQNGFSTGGSNGYQSVSVASDISSPSPYAAGVAPNYWVMVEVSEQIPQFFGNVAGNSLAYVRVRSVAAIVQTVVSGSAMLLNREYDCPSGSSGICGVDLSVGSGGVSGLTASGGVWMASTRDGSSLNGDSGHWATENGGSVTAPFVYIRQTGNYSGGSWSQTPTNGRADGAGFEDPMRGLGQPAAPSGLTNIPVVGGVIYGGSAGSPVELQPGNYYATNTSGNATGQPMQISGSVEFSNNGTGFGNYVFFGGLTHSGSTDTAIFDPGSYIFAGVQQSGGSAGTLFNTDNLNIQDQTTGSINSDAGEIFVFTDTHYPGLTVPAAVQTIASQLYEGIGGFVQDSGGTTGTLSLHGLNAGSSNLPGSLAPFAPVVVWQDQRNSSVLYSSNGYLNSGCASNPDICQKTTSQIATDNTSYAAMEMRLTASGSAALTGVVYQPRGARITVTGNANFSGPMQIVGGALTLTGVTLSLQGPARAD
jgi:hypothetical protein